MRRPKQLTRNKRCRKGDTKKDAVEKKVPKETRKKEQTGVKSSMTAMQVYKASTSKRAVAESSDSDEIGSDESEEETEEEENDESVGGDV